MALLVHRTLNKLWSTLDTNVQADTATDTLTFLFSIPASCHPVRSLQPAVSDIIVNSKRWTGEWSETLTARWIDDSIILVGGLAVDPSSVSVAILVWGQMYGNLFNFQIRNYTSALTIETCLLKGIREEIISSD